MVDQGRQHLNSTLALERERAKASLSQSPAVTSSSLSRCLTSSDWWSRPWCHACPWTQRYETSLSVWPMGHWPTWSETLARSASTLRICSGSSPRRRLRCVREPQVYSGVSRMSMTKSRGWIQIWMSVSWNMLRPLAQATRNCLVEIFKFLKEIKLVKIMFLCFY